MTPPAASTQLWLPPLSLAGCVRAAFMRDTRGLALQGSGLDSYLPATPLITLYVIRQGSADWLPSPGFSTPPTRYLAQPTMVAGPFTQPTHMRNHGECQVLMLFLLPDAWRALTGLDPGRLLNGVEAAEAVLPPDWAAWARSLLTVSDEASLWTAAERFLRPRWQALAPGRTAGQRYADWAEALAVRAATSAAGRSLRQIERRVKAWAGLPMRELRAVSRAEKTFLAVAARQDSPGFNWADIAADAEYADQSHLCRETRRLTGFSPQELRQRIQADEAFWAYRVWR